MKTFKQFLDEAKIDDYKDSVVRSKATRHPEHLYRELTSWYVDQETMQLYMDVIKLWV